MKGLGEILDSASLSIGLRAQGHMPAIRRMLAEGRSWRQIGDAIGWDGETAKRWYEMESASEPRAKP